MEPSFDEGDGSDEGESGSRDRRRRARGGVPRKQLSEIIDDVSRDESRERISIADLRNVMDARAFGALLLLFALPNALPMPPGTSGVLGLPLVFLSVQMMLGRSPWLPQFIARRSFARAEFARIVGAMNPYLRRAERLLQPRLTFLTSPRSERVLAIGLLVLSVVLLLPIPLGNMLPALAISVVALGLLQHDGAWVIAGCLIGAVSLVVVWGVFWVTLKGALLLFAEFLS